MNGSPRPLLALGAPEVGVRFTQPSRNLPRLGGPTPQRQGERLTPQFRQLVEAFDAQRATLTSGGTDEVDPELVVVFDLAGTVEQFRNAVNRIAGLEFLTEFLDEDTPADDDFSMQTETGPTTASVQRSLYLVMSNNQAVTELISLFDQWQADPEVTFAHGLGRFKSAFAQLRAIRRWGPSDRIRETGLLEDWNDKVLLVGASASPVLVEIELWHRRDASERDAAEARLRGLVATDGGTVINRAYIGEIAYHALLVELPMQQVETVVRDGAGAIAVLDANDIMFVSPFIPMIVGPSEPTTRTDLPAGQSASGLPRIALLDGLPVINHQLLADRLVVDDPEGLGGEYPVASRHHGTAMASLIIHGDLSAPDEPMARPLYVRPIMQPHPVLAGHEQVLDSQLFADLLHRAIRRIVVGEAGQAPAAQSVRVINLSVGAESRALVRRMSPVGRLLDWLAVEYNLLFIVSAGNHHRMPLTLPAQAASNVEDARAAARQAVRDTSRTRGILPPGDAMNALTIGAIHADAAGELNLPDTVWNLVEDGAPALYSALGPGVGRSIKPEILFPGGRALYVRPVLPAGATHVNAQLAHTEQTGPGVQAAAPGSGGDTSAVSFTHGTSNATALVTRQADRVFDLLEAGAASTDDIPFPDSIFDPVLAKALLVHSTGWGPAANVLTQALQLDGSNARRELTTLLGYGVLDPALVGASTNRATLIAADRISREQRHTYRIPLPESLRSRAEWHRFTVTLAYMAPTVGELTRYRAGKVFFEKLDDNDTGGARIDAHHNAVRRGSCQHEVIDGQKALIFADQASLPVHVECMDDAHRLTADTAIRYALMVSVETAVTTSQTIHEEIRARLRARLTQQVRAQSSR